MMIVFTTALIPDQSTNSTPALRMIVSNQSQPTRLVDLGSGGQYPILMAPP
jgi:hypothetical protein